MGEKKKHGWPAASGTWQTSAQTSGSRLARAQAGLAPTWQYSRAQAHSDSAIISITISVSGCTACTNRTRAPSRKLALYHQRDEPRRDGWAKWAERTILTLRSLNSNDAMSHDA
eukprot:5520568-Prymnesium_polylepis.1